MRDPDTQPGAGCFHCLEQFGRIVEVVAMSERRWQKPRSRLQLDRLGFGQDRDRTAGTLAHAIPQAAVPGKVVIAGQQPPMARMARHAGDGLDDRAVLGTLGIEHVACDNHMVRVVIFCRETDRIDCLEACFGKSAADLGSEAAERLAKLPIGRVNESHPCLHPDVIVQGLIEHEPDANVFSMVCIFLAMKRPAMSECALALMRRGNIADAGRFWRLITRLQHGRRRP